MISINELPLLPCDDMKLEFLLTLELLVNFLFLKKDKQVLISTQSYDSEILRRDKQTTA